MAGVGVAAGAAGCWTAWARRGRRRPRRGRPQRVRLFRAPDGGVATTGGGAQPRNVVVVDGAGIVGDPAAAARTIAPLRALRPEMDTFDV